MPPTAVVSVVATAATPTIRVGRIQVQEIHLHRGIFGLNCRQLFQHIIILLFILNGVVTSFIMANFKYPCG